MEKEIEQNKEKYEDMMHAAQKGKEGLKQLVDKNSLNAKKDNGDASNQSKWDEHFTEIKFEGISF